MLYFQWAGPGGTSSMYESSRNTETARHKTFHRTAEQNFTPRPRTRCAGSWWHKTFRYAINLFVSVQHKSTARIPSGNLEMLHLWDQFRNKQKEKNICLNGLGHNRWKVLGTCAETESFHTFFEIQTTIYVNKRHESGCMGRGCLKCVSSSQTW